MGRGNEPANPGGSGEAALAEGRLKDAYEAFSIAARHGAHAGANALKESAKANATLIVERLVKSLSL